METRLNPCMGDVIWGMRIASLSPYQYLRLFLGKLYPVRLKIMAKPKQKYTFGQRLNLGNVCSFQSQTSKKVYHLRFDLWLDKSFHNGSYCVIVPGLDPLYSGGSMLLPEIQIWILFDLNHAGENCAFQRACDALWSTKITSMILSMQNVIFSATCSVNFVSLTVKIKFTTCPSYCHIFFAAFPCFTFLCTIPCLISRFTSVQHFAPWRHHFG